MPTPSGAPIAAYEQTLEAGVEYRYPLYFHCGIDFLGTFNGLNWYASEQLVSPEAEGLPVANSQTILGTFTLIDAGRIEYRAGGQLIAVYAPKSDKPPGCA